MATTAIEKIKIALVNLVLDQPFFGVLALRLHIEQHDGIPTMATDGRSLFYNEAFTLALSADETMGVIAHEVLHCANGHVWRRDNREQLRFNVACDYAINPILLESKFKLPAGCLVEPAFAGKSADWIYDRIQVQQMPKGANAGKPGCGGPDVLDATGEGAEDGASEAEWQQATQQAAAAAEACGNLPAHLKRFAKAATEPRVDWRSVLRRFVQAAAKADYAWTRPSMRHLARGLYLPSLRSEAMGPIAIAVDTSGSIDAVLLNQFAAEINAIAGEMKPARVFVIYCDAAVGRIDTFEQDDVIELEPVGGGGTSFIPALDAAEKLDDEPCCMVYLTDLQGAHRDEPPPFPVLWATTIADEVPYGEVVPLTR